jgi:hypothetical protein
MSHGAFNDSWRLTTLTLGEGLDKIGELALMYCTSLHEIIIPNTIKVITNGARLNSYNLPRMHFWT